jgi:hypothetical protein
MVPANPTPAPATVSPRYDFPSAQSIPPVNIMAPEPSAPRPASAPAQVPADANGQAAVTPVPPRRPPQVRAAPPAVPPRPAASRPEPPPVAGDTPVPAPPSAR